MTQLEVLHFAGWMPLCTREEFDEYRAEHPELESFPPFNFGVSKREANEESEDRGDVS